MPIYEFKCPTCSRTTEWFSKFYDTTNLVECEFCRGQARRIMSRHTPLWMGGIVDQARKDQVPVTQAYRQGKRVNFENEKGRRKRGKYQIKRKQAEQEPSPVATFGPGGKSGGGLIRDVKVEEKDRPYLK